MSSTPPPRRFKPELIETTTLSSKKQARFAPQPIETSSRHGGPAKDDTNEEDVSESSAPMETNNGQKRRKFAPEPIETTSRHGGPATKDHGDDESTAAGSNPPRRKFAPQPIETTTRHGGPARQQDEAEAESAAALPGTSKNGGRRRFAPQPVETSSRSNRKKPAIQEEINTQDRPSGSKNREEKLVRRKFAPQLIETASRSRKSGDTGPTVALSDKTNVTPSDAPPLEKTPTPPLNSPTTEHPQHARPIFGVDDTTRTPERQHSYKVPALEVIESSESDKSAPPSLSRSQSGDSNTSEEGYRDATRRRESLDDRFSGYLLALAARAAEKQLREQAAAAYPNFNKPEPVTHYVNVSGSEDDNVQDHSYGKVGPLRHDSEEEKWVFEEMKRHGEQVYNQAKNKGGSKLSAVASSGRPNADAWITEVTGRPLNNNLAPQESVKGHKVIGGQVQDPDLKQMRKAASPPMLGGDLEFPRCPSPEHARFDVTQRPEQLQRVINGDFEPCQETKGLWQGGNKREEPPPTSKVSITEETRSSDSGMWRGRPGRGPAGGLWGGFCTIDDVKASRSTSGIVTPARTPLQTPSNEREDPFSMLHMTPGTNAPAATGRRSAQLSPNPSYTNLALLSSSPPSSRSQRRQQDSSPVRQRKQRDSFAAKASARLELEAQLDAEFGDALVTQVFNYLSLGYPALARRFDDELARITGVELADLRADDALAEGRGARGYIRLGEAEPQHTRMTSAAAAGVAAAAGRVEPAREDETAEAGAAGWDSARDGEGEVEVQEHMCARWRALRMYVREWGRQMLSKERKGAPAGPGLDPHRAWGLPGRRGSWGN